MVGVRRVEHARLRVEDLEPALDFYTRVMGMVELGRDDEAVYLGCGMDENYDLAVTEGGTGVEHFGIRVEADEFDRHQAHLEANGVDVERRDDSAPNRRRGLALELPIGVGVELVEVDDRRYHHPNDVSFVDSAAPVHEDRLSVTPVDLDHITLLSPDVEREVTFLAEQLAFEVSDVMTTTAGRWTQSFTRRGHYHHDVAVFEGHDHELHHLAFAVRDVAHLTTLLDRFAQFDWEIELGIGRHGPGGNLFTYMWEPGGNRFEFTTEVATLDDSSETGFYDTDTYRKGNGVSMWGGPLPDGFREGSGPR